MKKKIENLSMQTQLTVVILSVIVLAFGIILYSGYSGQARSLQRNRLLPHRLFWRWMWQILINIFRVCGSFAYSPA